MVQTREELLIRAVVEDRASPGLKQIGKSSKEMARDVDRSFASVEGDARDMAGVVVDSMGRARDAKGRFIKSGTAVAASLDATKASAFSLGGALGTLRGKLAALGVGVSAAILIRQAFADAVNFSRAIAEVSTISDVSAEGLGRLEERVIRLADAHGESAVSITKGLYQTISAGVTDAGDALQVLTVSQQLATAGLASTAETVDLLTTAINSYGFGIEEATRISDTFFTGVRVGKTTVGELAGSLGQVLPIAASLKVPLEDVVGLVAAITARGVSTSEAVTQVRAALVALLKSSEDINTVLGTVGKTFDDTTLRTRSLVDVLQDVRDATGGSESALTQLFGRVEATNAVLNTTGDNLEGVKKTLDEVRDSAGATAEALAKIQNADGSRARRALNGLRVGLQEVGTRLLEIPFEVSDAIGAAASEIGTALEGFGNFQLPGENLIAYREEAARVRGELELLRAEREKLNLAAATDLEGAGFNLERISFQGEGNVQRPSVAIRFELDDLPAGVGRVLEGEDIRINVPIGFDASEFADIATRARDIGNSLFEGGEFSAERLASSLTSQLQDNFRGIEIDGQLAPLVTTLANGLEKTVRGFRASLLEDGTVTVTPVLTQTTEEERNAPPPFQPQALRSGSLASTPDGGVNLRLQEITAQSERQAQVIESLNEQTLGALEEQRNSAAAAIESVGAQVLGTYDRQRKAVEDQITVIQKRIFEEFRGNEVTLGQANLNLANLAERRSAILEEIDLKERQAEQREQEKSDQEEINRLLEDRRRILDSDDFGGGFRIGLQDNAADTTGGRIGARAGDQLFRGVEDSVASFSSALLHGEDSLEAFGDGMLDVLEQILIQTAASAATSSIFGAAHGGRVPDPGGVRYFAGGAFGSTTPDPRDTIPALLRPREFVLRPEATRSAPVGSLERFNQTGDFGSFAREIGPGGGGQAAVVASAPNVSQTVNLGGITITMPGGGGVSDDRVRRQLTREIMAAVEEGIRGANDGLVKAVRQAGRG